MATFVFKGVAFVTGVRISVEAHTLSDAIAKIARDESSTVDLEPGDIQWTWADLNSGVERPAPPADGVK